MSSSSGTIRVLRIAIFSRVLVLTLILFWRLLFHPYDTSASINPPCLSGYPSSQVDTPPLWPRVGSAIEKSIVWDGVYFVRIAECGYEYEQTYAFFPILPVLISLMSRSVFAPLVPIIGYRAVLGLSGYVLNNVVFLFAAVFFYKLSVLILKDHAAAMRSSVLFCFNPASIFYSSIYSESLYAFFSLSGIYNLYSGYNAIAVLLFTLSALARSNGVLNAGFFCFQALHQAYEAIFRKKKAMLALQVVLIAIVQSACIFAAFIMFQAYGYFNICAQPGIDTNDLRPWCKARIPRLYDYVQGHYWGVGFLRYFQVKQLPNFILASPMLSLAVCSIVQFAKKRHDILFSLGFQVSAKEKDYASIFCPSRASDELYSSISSKSMKGNLKQRWNVKQKKEITFEPEVDSQFKNQISSLAEQGYFSFMILPFIYHLMFLSVMAFFVMHVQVASRFLSASPPIYWFASYVLDFYNRRFGYVIWAYFLAYVLLGNISGANQRKEHICRILHLGAFSYVVFILRLKFGKLAKWISHHMPASSSACVFWCYCCNTSTVPRFAQLSVTSYYAPSSALHYAISQATSYIEDSYSSR